MLSDGIFVQTFLPVLVGVLASFLLWFGGQWLVGYLRDKKAKASMLREFEEETVTNIGILDSLVKAIPKSFDRQEIPVYIPHRMRLEVYRNIVQSGEIRLVNDISKQRLILYVADLCSRFNDFVDNTELLLAALLGKPNAVEIARRRLNGLTEQAVEDKEVLSQWLKELQRESPAKENKDNKSHDNLMKKLVVAQAPVYFFASLLFIQVAGLSQKGESNWHYWLFIGLGLISLVWAFILCVDAWRGQRIFRKVEKDLRILYWIISIMVFGVALVTNSIAVLQTGIGDLYYYIFFYAGIALLILLLIHFVQSAVQK
jgi:hypothetical protein